MPAVELMNRRIQIADNAFASIRILEVDPAILGSQHQYKYSLAYIVDGECVMVYLLFRRDKNEGWGRRSLCNSDSSAARQRDRSYRQELEVGPIRQTYPPSPDENAGRRHLQLYARYNHSIRLIAREPDPARRLHAQARYGR